MPTPKEQWGNEQNIKGNRGTTFPSSRVEGKGKQDGLRPTFCKLVTVKIEHGESYSWNRAHELALFDPYSVLLKTVFVAHIHRSGYFIKKTKNRNKHTPAFLSSWAFGRPSSCMVVPRQRDERETDNGGSPPCSRPQPTSPPAHLARMHLQACEAPDNEPLWFPLWVSEDKVDQTQVFASWRWLPILPNETLYSVQFQIPMGPKMGGI